MSYFLRSERLGFRLWEEDDLPLAMGLWCDPEVMRHMGGAMSVDQAKARLELERSREREFGVQYWPMFLLGSGEHAGCSGLRPFHDEVGVFELGVHVRKEFWSERLGEEAARAVMAHAFENLGVRALTAGHGPGHADSKRLIERLGFHWTHEEPWGAEGILHPFYRLERPV